jgi:hypothetical protein
VIPPYDHEALWSKAKVFLNRAMDPDPARSFDEQALWASAALELLAKAALARVSPLLIAEPTEDGVNILIATGLIESTAKFTSVSASTIFKRCEKAFRPFNAADAQKFAAARNEYLHGSDIGFMTLPPHAWWPRYWALATILITAQDRDIEDLVGPDRVQVVEDHLKENSKNIEHRAQTLVARAKQRIAQHRAGTLPARIQLEWQSKPDLTICLSYSTTETCPACGGSGTLEGDDGSDMSYEYGYDNFDGESEGDVVSAWANINVPADYFSCSTCHLVLDGYELIEQAGLPGEFEVIDEDPVLPEAEYGND